jgi:hypothetical protein
MDEDAHVSKRHELGEKNNVLDAHVSKFVSTHIG